VSDTDELLEACRRAYARRRYTDRTSGGVRAATAFRICARSQMWAGSWSCARCHRSISAIGGISIGCAY